MLALLPRAALGDGRRVAAQVEENERAVVEPEAVVRKLPEAYRWLITWPAGERNGFSVVGGLGWVQFDAGAPTAASIPLEAVSV